jgi:hypothetical protein
MEQGGAMAKVERNSVREADLPRHLGTPGSAPAADEKPADKPAKPDATVPREDGAAAPKGDGDAEGDAPAAAADLKEGELGKDPQLDHALELLKSWQVFKTFVAQKTSNG